MDYKLSFLRESISIVNQSPTLFNDTIEKNIAYGETEIDQQKLVEAAEISGCLEFIDKLPEGYKSEIGDDGVLLSGGQRQRIAIARAFYKNSPIIILDEATSALDNESELIVQEALEKLINNRTTIVIAHRLSTIQYADEIIVIDGGKIIERGNHIGLVAHNGVYKKLYEMQAFV
jgi:subfamily B ATP-binding cassette protein MsbA